MRPPIGGARDFLFHSGQAPFQQLDGLELDTNQEELEPQSALRHLASLATSIHFAFALQLSGLANPSRVTRFLVLPSVGRLIPLLEFWQREQCPSQYYARGNEIPRLGGRWLILKENGVDWKLIVGAAIFGISWGMAKSMLCFILLKLMPFPAHFHPKSMPCPAHFHSPRINALPSLSPQSNPADFSHSPQYVLCSLFSL